MTRRLVSILQVVKPTFDADLHLKPNDVRCVARFIDESNLSDPALCSRALFTTDVPEGAWYEEPNVSARRLQDVIPSRTSTTGDRVAITDEDGTRVYACDRNDGWIRVPSSRLIFAIATASDAALQQRLAEIAFEVRPNTESGRALARYSEQWRIEAELRRRHETKEIA